MTDDIFVYCVKTPPNVKEFVTPCLDGYTVYIDERLSHEQRLKEYNHAVRHIVNRDFEKHSAQEIEREAHSNEI